MNIFIEIETRDEGLSRELLEKPIKLNRKADLPGNVLLMKVHMSVSTGGTLVFLLSFGTGADTGLIANWLYEKINGRATKLHMDRIEVQINKNEIERVIAEKIGKTT